MIEFQVVKTMDEKEWEDHIFYSGADSYPWWVEFLKPDHNGEIGLYHITGPPCAGWRIRLAGSHQIIPSSWKQS
jgi:hypothetical protein